MKIQLIYLSLCSMAHAMSYISQIAANRMAIAAHRPMAFRPGVMLHQLQMQRPWGPRLVHSASHRVPYVVYRNAPQRYVMKPMTGVTRNVHTMVATGQTPPWRGSSRFIPTTERDFPKTANAAHSHGARGAIHTIPAPNLSLSEKPIVVVDADSPVTAEPTKNKEYEVTEKFLDTSGVHLAKIEQPIGFSKANAISTPEFQTLVQNGAALQLAAEQGLSVLSLQQNPLQQNLLQQNLLQQNPLQQNLLQQNQLQQNQLQQNALQQQINQQLLQANTIAQHSIPQPAVSQQITPHHSIIPQQLSIQGFPGLNTQEVIHASPEGIVISPSALYQPDPAFMQKLTNQLLQRFPGIEFIPYAAEFQPPQVTQTPQPQVNIAPTTLQPKMDTDINFQLQSQLPPRENPPELFLLQNEQITKQPPSSFIHQGETQKNFVQREADEGTVVNFAPQPVANVTENEPVPPISQVSSLQNITLELITADSKPSTTTIRNVETSTEDKSPIYYPQIGQSIGSVIANGLFTAVNDVRAAAAMEQMEKPYASTTNQQNVTTTTSSTTEAANPEQNNDKANQTITDLKPHPGSPFKKAEDVKVSYTLLKNADQQTKVNKDGSVYAGQLVEASVSEDHEFNKHKASLLARRAPIRLAATATEIPFNNTTKLTVIKAKIPPRSKLTFDDKTGEPVLRIYASYVDTPAQKELLSSRLATMKHAKDLARMQDTTENWKSATTNSVAKPQGFEVNKVSGQFGLKLKSRSDDYVPLFDDYEE